MPRLVRDPLVFGSVPSPSAGTSRTDVLALTRALVFTKEAFRTLRSRVKPGSRPSADEAVIARATDALAGRAADACPSPAPRRGPALTPWDLMDEDDSPAGVTFAFFQRRLREVRHHKPVQQRAA